jgi:hypothetical protein
MVYFEVEYCYYTEGKFFTEYFYTSSRFYYQKINQLLHDKNRKDFKVVSFLTRQVTDSEVVEFIDNQEFTIFQPPALDSRIFLSKEAS